MMRHRYPKRIHTNDWDTKPPCAVIITVFGEASYDNLFRHVLQQSPDPNHSVAIFESDYDSLLNKFLPYFHGIQSIDEIAQVAAALQATTTTPNDSNRRSPSPPSPSSPIIPPTGTEGQLPLQQQPMSSRQARSILAMQHMLRAMEEVEPESVVFNFECCGLCSHGTFGSEDQCKTIVELISQFLDKGFMVMCSDFTLKALITQWDTTKLGRNPFMLHPNLKCNNMMEVYFDSAQLLSCKSAQLQNVGRLKDGFNTAELRCLPGTVVCSLVPLDETVRPIGDVPMDGEDQTVNLSGLPDKDKAHSLNGEKNYELQLLSIATRIDFQYVAEMPEYVDGNNAATRAPSTQSSVTTTNPQSTGTIGSTQSLYIPKLTIGERSGYVGHATLTYPSGGVLLVSTGHWIELSRIHADRESTLYAIEMQYGRRYRQSIEQELLDATTDTERDAIIQRFAQQLIQSSAPSSYSIGPRSSRSSRSAVVATIDSNPSNKE